ncbi:DUF7507 domain-containing protein [Paenibacillus pinistramenti]|uniref:DUF7507 domain-containing protein n=1 Tax=Paenibacillus pinistramenti TaxID=1768003 RepID=UPI003B8320C0
MPLVVRAQVNATGAITFTGNTLGLSRSDTAGVPGTQDSIGAFSTVSTSSVFGSYPSGTTSAYQSNSSSAILTLPSGSTVVYAELIWGGSYINGSVDLSSAINKTVSLTVPSGTVYTVTPDTATANTVNLGSGTFAYVRSADVTSIVRSGGAGTYITGGVVGTIVIPSDPTGNHAGWTLAVIYSNPSLPFRNMSLRAGAILVQSTSDPVNTTITGFATPTSGLLSGRALFSAQEGDANRSGDQALFGPNTSSLVALSGPNNFANNFFASQINNDAGSLNTTGTFGTRNQTNGSPGSNIVGGRQGWDITNVDVSARLLNNQSSAVLQLTTSGDAYVVNANAIQININAPNVALTKSANTAGTIVGDLITYTVVLSNTGTASASSVVLSDALPAGTTFVAGSVVVAGVTRPSYNITAGIPIGTLVFGTSVTVTYQARVTSLPTPQTIPNQANAAFTFQSVAGGSTISGVIPSNTVTLPVYSPVLGMVKSASTVNATVGDTVVYTVQITNTGNIGAVTTFTDNIPAGSTYVPGSFTVNGTPTAGNPAAGIAIGTIAAGGTATVQFSVLIGSLPSPPQLTDQAAAAYTFTVPDGRTVSGSASSNTLTVPVSLPNVAVVKSANLSDAAVGETLQYTSVITNSGGSAITSVVLSDAVPEGSSFVAGSAAVDGAARTSANPATGITVGSISPGRSAAVTFLVTVNAVPASSQLSNSSSVSYNSGSFSAIVLSNTVNTPVYQPVISVVKSSSVTSTTVGSSFLYNLTVRNTGNLAASVTLTDTIPAGTVFAPGTVTVNGAVQPAASPVTGIGLGSLPPGGSAAVAFQVNVQSLPSPPVLNNQGTAAYTYTLPSGRNLSGSAVSNTVSLPVSSPSITIVKTANLASAAVGENLAYTLTVSNPSSAAISGILVSDPVPAGAAFIPGSVLLNGTALPNANPNNGINIGTLAPGASSTLIFQVNVSSLPNAALFNNRASASFTSGSFTGSSISNILTTPIFTPVITMVKSANLQQLTVGNLLAFNILISNAGNIASTLVLTDTLPPQAVFQENSVIIGGTPLPAYSPLTGIPVGPLSPGESVNVSFLVTITGLPPSQQLSNTAAAAYSFTLPDGRNRSANAVSNTLNVQVSAPNVSTVMSVNAPSAVTGDVLTFTTVVTNNSTSAVNNVVLSDPLPANTVFVPGTVIAGGVSQPSAVPSAGIPVGTLAPGASVTVTFEVNVTMPIPSEINNQSQVSFTSGVFSGSSASNVTTTPVTQPQISIVKSSTADITGTITVGDTVVYNVLVSNTGNLAANVTLTDPLIPNTAFVPNSVIVNGTPFPGVTPDAGINIGSVPPGTGSFVSFSVDVISLPSPQQISNQVSAAYTYIPPDGRLLNGTAVSNTLTLPVSAPDVSAVKSTSFTAAAIGDIIPYTLQITNEGADTINNIIVSDPVPDGASFVEGSVTLNGSPLQSANPAVGFAIGSLTPGASATVAFRFTVNAVPSNASLDNQATVTFTSGVFAGSTLSNAVAVPVFQPSINTVKSASTANATVGDTVSYTLKVSNNGNYGANVTVTDNIPSGTSFVPNSVLINGRPLPAADPTAGIPAGVVAAGTTTAVTFSVLIESLPSPQFLNNQAVSAFSFTLPDERTLAGTSLSNTVSIPVSAPNVSVVKSTIRTATTIGDSIVYSTTITNNGIAAINNVVFNDALPSEISFVAGSVLVDGTARQGVNPATGITMGSIAPGASATVAFTAAVNTLPPSGLLNNQSSASFTSGALAGAAFSNTVTTPVYLPTLNANKTASLPRATVGDTLTYTIDISNTGNYGASATLTDTTPPGTTLVPNSVIIGGLPAAGADPSAGVPLGTIDQGATLTVLFSVVINTLPASQLLANQASIATAYTLPDGRTFNQSIASNITQTPVSSPNVSIVLSSPQSDAVVSDTVAYTITVTNSGISAINNAILSDPIPAGSSFVPGTVFVDGALRPGANPANGIALGTLGPGASIPVTFNTVVNTLPNPSVLASTASVSFNSGALSSAAFSNTLVIPVYQPILAIVKSANTANATVGDTLTYSLSVTNTGNYPAAATVSDAVPAGAVFVPNSVFVNQVPVPGADPASGIDIGIVQPGDTVQVTISLQVTVVSLPTSQQLTNQASAAFTFTPPDGRTLSGSALSNTLVIPVSSPDVSVVKSTSSIDAVVGDVITYTIVVTNNGIAAVDNVVLIDPIPAGSQFVTGSVNVDGRTRPGASPSAGIPIGTLAVSGSSTVTFQVEVAAV